MADAITIDGRKEWIKFCSETNVWTRWRCRRCLTNIPAGLHGKHQKAVSAKNIQDRLPHVVDRKEGLVIKKLRAQVELLSKQQSAWKGQEAQGVPTRRGSGLEEDCKMEVEEETDNKKKLDEQKKSLQKQLRDIEKFANLDLVFRDRQKENLEEIVARD